MAKKSKDQKMQQAAMQMQIIEQQIRQLEEQFNQVEEKRKEMTALEMSLDGLRKSKNKKSFSNVGLGIYAKIKVLDDSNLLVNTGKGIFTTKKVGEVKKILKDQSKELEKVGKEIVENIQSLAHQAQKLQLELQE